MSENNDSKNALERAGENPAVDGVEPEIKGAPTATPGDLMSVLESYNIKSPDDLTGLVESEQRYRQGYGRSQNDVGELRRKIAELEGQITQNQSEYREGYEEPISKADVRQVIREEVQAMQAAQTEAQARYYEERGKIEAKPNWKKVQPHFDKAVTDPRIYQALQTGQMTMKDLYHEINERVLMSEIKNVINQIPKEGVVAPPGQVGEPPTTNRVAHPLPPDLERAEKIKKAKADMNAEAVLNQLIPDNDPLLRF